MRKEVFVIHPNDNVATLVSQDGKAGSSWEAVLDGNPVTFTLNQDVPYCHKFAIKPIPKGTPVLKYGYSIGSATVDIKVGDYVHIHNIESNRGRGDLFKKEAV